MALHKYLTAGNCISFSGNEDKDVKQQKFLTANKK